MADDLILPSGLCVVVKQKPGALSLTEIVTSVVTVLNQCVCYSTMGSVTVGSYFKILLWRKALSCMIADNRRQSFAVNSKGLSLFVKGHQTILSGREVFSPVCTEKGQILLPSLLIFGDSVELCGICISAVSLRGS